MRLASFRNVFIDVSIVGGNMDRQGVEELKMETAGYRLTASEESYCIQWLSKVGHNF